MTRPLPRRSSTVQFLMALAVAQNALASESILDSLVRTRSPVSGCLGLTGSKGTTPIGHDPHTFVGGAVSIYTHRSYPNDIMSTPSYQSNPEMNKGNERENAKPKGNRSRSISDVDQVDDETAYSDHASVFTTRKSTRAWNN